MRSSQFLSGTAVVGLALVGNMFRDAYYRAMDVCEMFPQFEFASTFHDELLLHHTWLPLVPTPVSTIPLVIAMFAALLLTYFRLVELLWLFVFDVFSGRWVYNLLFVHIPAWVPFLASEPSMPDLLSDPEDYDHIDSLDAANNGTIPKASATAMAKLVQVRLKHENHTIERPDHWLVFDPDQDELVPKKDLEAKRLQRTLGSRSSTESSSTTSTGSPPPSPLKQSQLANGHLPSTEKRQESPTHRNR